MIEASDAALVRACRRGNEEAWEALVHRYQRFVHSIPRRAGLDDDAAADVFQEVFVALVQGLDKIDDPDRVGAWILTTAKRATWRTVRRRIAARTGQTTLDEEAEEVPDVDPLPAHRRRSHSARGGSSRPSAIASSLPWKTSGRRGVSHIARVRRSSAILR